MSTLPVVEQILRETGTPMSVREIVEYANGRLPTKSKTPDTVVARDLSMDIKRKGESSQFIRTAPGRYTMRELVVNERDGDAAAEPTSMVATSVGERAGPKPATRPAAIPAANAASDSV